MSAGEPLRVVLAPGQVPGDGEHRVVEVSPSLRLLVTRVGGRLHALDDACNHGGCPLSSGSFEPTRVICPCHSMAFDLRDGTLLSRPRLAGDQRTFPVEEAGGRVVVVVDPRD